MDAVTYGRVEKAIDYLQAQRASQPTLSAVAAHVGLSRHHFQRTFRRAVGISPKRFLQFLTAADARELLRESRPLLEVAYAAGLSGPGRLHDLTVAVDAMTPAEVRELGAGARVRWGVADGPLGPTVLGSTDRGVCTLEFLEDGDSGAAEAVLSDAWPGATLERDDREARRVSDRLLEAPIGPELRLHVRGTNYQIRVWRALLSIPAGAVTTYRRLAVLIGESPSSARVVGGAVAKNPVAVLIPCHRVIRSTGEVGVYRWGGARKLALLARERAGTEGAGAVA